MGDIIDFTGGFTSHDGDDITLLQVCRFEAGDFVSVRIIDDNRFVDIPLELLDDVIERMERAGYD